MIELLMAIRAINFCQRFHKLAPDEVHWADKHLAQSGPEYWAKRIDVEKLMRVKCPRKGEANEML